MNMKKICNARTMAEKKSFFKFRYLYNRCRYCDEINTIVLHFQDLSFDIQHCRVMNFFSKNSDITNANYVIKQTIDDM